MSGTPPSWPQSPEKPLEARVKPITAWQEKWLKLNYHHPDLREAANACERWAQSLIKSEPLVLILHGPTGTGKTHLAKRLIAWCRHMAMDFVYPSGDREPTFNHPPSISMVAWPDVADAIRSKTADRIIEDIRRDDIVAIDDLGAENDPWKDICTRLVPILDSRCEGCWTVITTNIPPGNWAATWDARVADRLMRCDSEIVSFEGIPSFATVNNKG